MLQAKKLARDAKRKKLEAMFDQHKKHEQQQLETKNQVRTSTAGESSSEQIPTSATGTNLSGSILKSDAVDAETPSYLNASYQHTGNTEVEVQPSSGGDIEQGGTGKEEASSSISTPKSKSYGGLSSGENELSLRTEVQSLIHNNSDPDDVIHDPSTVLDKLESNPQRILGVIFLIFFMLWCL